MSDLRDKIAEKYAKERGWWREDFDTYVTNREGLALEFADQILALLKVEGWVKVGECQPCRATGLNCKYCHGTGTICTPLQWDDVDWELILNCLMAYSPDDLQTKSGARIEREK